MELAFSMFMSALVYGILRCTEFMVVTAWRYFTHQTDDIDRLIEVIEEYKRQLDEDYENKETKENG